MEVGFVGDRRTTTKIEQGGIGDLEIRPCTPPGRIIPAVGYVKHSRGLSAVAEQDEHADVEEPIVTPRTSLERRLRTASNFVFRDHGGTTCEMLLSEHQERLLCELFDEENLVRYNFISILPLTHT